MEREGREHGGINYEYRLGMTFLEQDRQKKVLYGGSLCVAPLGGNIGVYCSAEHCNKLTHYDPFRASVFRVSVMFSYGELCRRYLVLWCGRIPPRLGYSSGYRICKLKR